MEGESQKKLLICNECKMSIMEGESRCALISYLNNKEIEKHDYHMRCWRTYFNRAAQKKAKGMQSFMKKLIGKLKAKTEETGNQDATKILEELPQLIEKTREEFNEEQNKTKKFDEDKYE